MMEFYATTGTLRDGTGEMREETDGLEEFDFRPCFSVEAKFCSSKVRETFKSSRFSLPNMAYSTAKIHGSLARLYAPQRRLPLYTVATFFTSAIPPTWKKTNYPSDRRDKKPRSWEYPSVQSIAVFPPLPLAELPAHTERTHPTPSPPAI